MVRLCLVDGLGRVRPDLRTEHSELLGALDQSRSLEGEYRIGYGLFRSRGCSPIYHPFGSM